MLDQGTYNLDKIFRMFVNICILVAVVWLFSYLSDVLIPFAIAALLAYLIQPLVILVSKVIKKKVLAIFISLMIVFLSFSLVAYICIPIVSAEVSHLAVMVKNLAGNSDLASKAAKRLPPDMWDYLKDVYKTIDAEKMMKSDTLMNASKWVFSKSFKGFQGIFATTKILIGIVLGSLVIFLYLVFILSDYQNLKDGWPKLLPESIRESCIGFVKDFDFQMNRYFRAQALVALIIGILFAIGFSLISLPLGIMLGLLIGLLNMIPYFQIVGLIPASMLAVTKALETNDSLALIFLQIAIVFIVIQIIQDAFIVPKIMGEVTGFSPAVILLSISVWGKILGMLGIIIAIPATCLFFAYYKRVVIKGQNDDS
jgi:predicted PurR-regulated permease PerM